MFHQDNDNDFILPADIVNYPDHVIISIPQLFIATNENAAESRAVCNLRLIKYSDFKDIMHSDVLNIMSDDVIKSTEYCKRMVERYIETDNNKTKQMSDDDTISMSILNIIEKFYDNFKCFDQIDHTYVNPSTKICEYNLLRKYINTDDGTGQLSDCRLQTLSFGTLRASIGLESDPSIDNTEIFSYQQLVGQEELIITARKLLNDTDLNRMHYCLAYFSEVLLMRDDYLVDSTLKLKNVCLVFMILIQQSRPIASACANNLLNNFIGFMFDVIVRSRLITRWQQVPWCRNMLQDIIKNYDTQNLIVEVYRLESGQERYNAVMRQMANHKSMEMMLSSFTFSDYMSILESKKITIDGKTYYHFDLEFLSSLLTHKGFSKIAKHFDKLGKNNTLVDELLNEYNLFG